MKSLAWLRAWADLLDSRFVIPGTRVRFGIDPLLSLIPGIGELASPIFAVALMAQGVYQGVPKIILLRMAGNALLDAVIGAIPIAGVVGDLFWRANLRNLALLERHARPGVKPTRADYAFVGVVAALFGVVLILPVLVALWLTFYMVGLIGAR